MRLSLARSLGATALGCLVAAAAPEAESSTATLAVQVTVVRACSIRISPATGQAVLACSRGAADPARLQSSASDAVPLVIEEPGTRSNERALNGRLQSISGGRRAPRDPPASGTRVLAILF